MTSKDLPKNLLIISVVISYILKSICSFAHSLLFQDISFSWANRSIILIIMAIIFSIISILIIETKIFNKLTLLLNSKTIHSSIWDDVFDYKKGTTLRLVCNNVIYTGYLKYIEEKGKDSWIALSDYIIEENGTESKIPKDLSDSLIIVPMSIILRIETFY